MRQCDVATMPRTTTLTARPPLPVGTHRHVCGGFVRVGKAQGQGGCDRRDVADDDAVQGDVAASDAQPNLSGGLAVRVSGAAAVGGRRKRHVFSSAPQRRGLFFGAAGRKGGIAKGHGDGSTTGADHAERKRGTRIVAANSPGGFTVAGGGRGGRRRGLGGSSSGRRGLGGSSSRRRRLGGRGSGRRGLGGRDSGRRGLGGSSSGRRGLGGRGSRRRGLGGRDSGRRGLGGRGSRRRGLGSRGSRRRGGFFLGGGGLRFTGGGGLGRGLQAGSGCGGRSGHRVSMAVACSVAARRSGHGAAAPACGERTAAHAAPSPRQAGTFAHRVIATRRLRACNNPPQKGGGSARPDNVTLEGAGWELW